MQQVEDKQGNGGSALERCHRKFCEAAAELTCAVCDRSVEDAKRFHDSLTPAYETITAIRVDINTAVHEARMGEIANRTPCEGEEVLVDVCPCGDETWMQIGKVLNAWHDDERFEDAVWAAVEITRRLTEEENHGWQTDDSWNQCVFVCRLSYRGDDWRALWPANDRAREEWRCE